MLSLAAFHPSRYIYFDSESCLSSVLLSVFKALLGELQPARSLGTNAHFHAAVLLSREVSRIEAVQDLQSLL